ncbi:hypothetical protein [Thalassiella azotivora]
MFDVYCEHCTTRRMLSVSSVRGLVNDELGIVVVFECPCGQLGAWRTGRKHTEQAAPVVVAPSRGELVDA